MAKTELIGNMNCPECGFPDAEIRNDKGGNPYRFCPDCTAQYFTRGGVKAKNLLARLRPPPGASPPHQPAQGTVTEGGLKKPLSATESNQPAPAPKPARGSGLLIG